MTDEDIYTEDGPGVRYVIRLSRTATGTRTYTVGASLPGEDPSKDGEYLARLFAIDDVVRLTLDSGLVAPSDIADSLRPDATKRVHDMLALHSGPGWYTTAELVERLGVSRQTVVNLLTRMVKAGTVEKIIGGGAGNSSRYRLIVKSQNANTNGKGKN